MSSAYSMVCSRTDEGAQFTITQYNLDSPEFDDKDWGEFSCNLADVVYMAEQENVGFFHYEHWKNGSLLRRLKYNDDYFWLSVEGESETWEKELLFSPENLEIVLRANDSDRQAEVRDYWEKQCIQAEDSFSIIIGPLNIVKMINDFWNLPKEF